MNFRQSMAWLHTWVGLLLGFVLMIVFFFGALSVFDREIDRWAIPATRFTPEPLPSFDRVLRPIFERITDADAGNRAAARSRVNGELPARLPLMDWSVYKTHRDPVVSLYASFALPNARIPGDHIHGHVTVDPRNGRVLPDHDLKIGSEFFYPLHFGLHIEWRSLGYWIVGIASLGMLVALVSGVIIHRKLIRELFTFRVHGPKRRATLDLHNLTGVVALPFHFMFALTGLIIFAAIHFPVSTNTLRPLVEAHERQKAAATGLPLAPVGVATPLASVDAMIADAQKRWAARGMAGEVGFLFLNHIGDANGYVSVYRAGTDRIALTGQGIHYAAATGSLIREDPPASVIARTSEFLTGLHLQHFRHWPLRFLYLFGGLAGAVCIGTGFLFFVGKRKATHLGHGRSGARMVEAFALITVTGMLIATGAILVASRLLPDSLEYRGDLQRGIFWCAWLAAGIHAWWRTSNTGEGLSTKAWSEQCALASLLFCLAPVLNAATTAQSLPFAIRDGIWSVAGVDLGLLAGGFLAAGIAVRLRRRARESDALPLPQRI